MRSILLRVTQSGHGIGSSLDEQVAVQPDVYTFLLHELNVNYRPAASAAAR
jgi:hypothetical protein